MTPADKLAALEVRGRFALEVLRREEAINLANAALLVAAEEDPCCDVARSLDALDQLGAQARERIANHEGSAVETLNRYMFDELGFIGNQADYYDPRNSLLNQVIEKRTGIPITLSVVYMETGRRAGLRMEGVGMPGHFIVRAAVGTPDAALVDPFHAQIVDEDDCQQRLDIIYGGQVPLTDEHLRPVRTRGILVRLLGNLKAIYAQTHLYGRALAVVERILMLAPQAFTERRDRGILLAQLNRLPEAIADVQSYLNFAENAPDSDEVREELKKMQIRLAMLN